MKQEKSTSNLPTSALAMDGPADYRAPKNDHPAVLFVSSQPPRSASVDERFRLLDVFSGDQNQSRMADTLPQATGVHRRRSGTIADSFRHFVRKVPACDIVHCNVTEAEAWTMSALGQVLIARFFGKPVIADLGYSINEESFDQPSLLLRMILSLCTVAVVTSEHAAAVLARRGVNAVQIPEALASTKITDREITSVQPQILTVFPHADRIAAECVLKAFKLVKEKYPRAEMTILANDRDRDICLRMINERERTSIMVAAVDTGKAASCYAEADMFVNSSVAGGLRPMLRAMATGLPVVSASGFYRDELIIDHVNGLSYRENDPGALANRVIELIETPEMISALTGHARLTVADHTWSRISRRWLACYRRLWLSRHATNVAHSGHQSRQPI